MYNVGTTFLRTLFNSYATVLKVTTHKLESGNRKIKLEDPIITIEYERLISLKETGKTTVEMKQQDVKSQVEFGLWKVKRST